MYTSGKPFVIGGDFNATADEIRGLGILEKFGGVIIQPGQPTCRVGKEWRTLDYFIVSGGLVSSVVRCERRDETELASHYLVKLVLRLDPHLAQIRVLAKPRPFPDDRPVGPAPMPPPDWQDFSTGWKAMLKAMVLLLSRRKLPMQNSVPSPRRS